MRQAYRSQRTANTEPMLAAIERTRSRVRELEQKVEGGQWGAKSDLAAEKRVLARLKRSL